MEKLTHKIIEDCLVEFVNHSSYMVMILDEFGKILYANNALKNTLKANLENDTFDIWQYVNPYSKWLCQDTFSSMTIGATEALEIIFKDSEGVILHTEGKFNCFQVTSEFPKMIIGILEDVSERNLFNLDYMNLMRQFEENNAYLQLIYEIYNSLLENANSTFDDKIVTVLEKIGKKVYADRAFVLIYNHDLGVFNNVYEWCEEGIATKKNGMINLSLAAYENWISDHFNGNRNYIEDIDMLNSEDPMRVLLEPFGVMSTISLPMIKDGYCYGCVGFDSVKINRTNAEFETRLLSDVSKILLNAILNNVEELKFFKGQNKFEKVLLEAPLPIFIADKKRKIIFSNKALSILTKQNCEDLIRMDLDEIVNRFKGGHDHSKEVILNTDEDGLIYGYFL